eukprot:Opistho-1_new@8508
MGTTRRDSAHNTKAAHISIDSNISHHLGQFRPTLKSLRAKDRASGYRGAGRATFPAAAPAAAACCPCTICAATSACAVMRAVLMRVDTSGRSIARASHRTLFSPSRGLFCTAPAATARENALNCDCAIDSAISRSVRGSPAQYVAISATAAVPHMKSLWLICATRKEGRPNIVPFARFSSIAESIRATSKAAHTTSAKKSQKRRNWRRSLSVRARMTAASCTSGLMRAGSTNITYELGEALHSRRHSRASGPRASYTRRVAGFESVSYAFLIAKKASESPPSTLSGWYTRDSWWKACLSCVVVASAGTLSTS